MASAPPVTLVPLRPRPNPRRELPDRLPFLSGRRRWPRRARDRWAVRLALALPLIGLAVVATGIGGFVSVGHRQALAQAAAVRAGGSGLEGVGAAYPPLPTVLALVVPGGALGLCVVAALFAAVALHVVGEQVASLGLPRPVAVALLSPLFAVPAFAYLASQSVAGIASLCLIAVALQGFIRFAVDASTEGGFVAGLAFALAFCASPIALFYALAVGLATGLIARERFRRDRAAATATVGVLLFPTIFTVLAWAFLEWRFSGSVFGALVASPTVFAFPGGVGPSLLAAATTVGGALLHVPLFLAAAVYFARRAPFALVGYLLPVAGSIVAVWIGLLFTSITAYVLFTLIALIAVTRGLGRRMSHVLVAVALAQVVLAWMWPPASPGFGDWVSTLAAVLH